MRTDPKVSLISLLTAPRWETTVQKRLLSNLIMGKDQFYLMMKTFTSWAPKKLKLMTIKSWWTIISKKVINGIWGKRILQHWEKIYKGVSKEINHRFSIHKLNRATEIYRLKTLRHIWVRIYIMVACRLSNNMDKLQALNLILIAKYLHLLSHPNNQLKVDIEHSMVRPLIHMLILSDIIWSWWVNFPSWNVEENLQVSIMSHLRNPKKSLEEAGDHLILWEQKYNNHQFYWRKMLANHWIKTEEQSA